MSVICENLRRVTVAIVCAIAVVVGGACAAWAEDGDAKAGRDGLPVANQQVQSDNSVAPSTKAESVPAAIEKPTQPAPPDFFQGARDEKPAPWPDVAGDSPATWPSPLSDSAGGGKTGEELSSVDLMDRIQHDMFTISWTTMFWGTALGVLLRQTGFALLQIGFCRSKVAINIAGKCLLICPLVGLAFWAYGFAIGWGNWHNGPVAPGFTQSLGPGTSLLNSGIGIGAQADGAGQLTGEYRWGLAGTRGFCLRGVDDSAAVLLFVLNLAFAITCATIPIGALAERWSWKNFCVYGLWVVLPFSLVANWIWGGGWLAQLGRNWQLGHGAVDFAGSGVVYGLGGVIALAGAKVLGPRLGRYVSGKPIDFAPRHARIVILGTLLLVLLEIIGFAQLRLDNNADPNARLIARNTLLAFVVGGCAAAGIGLWRRRKGMAVVFCQGALAGYAAISAPCAFVEPWAAAVIGAIAAALLMLSISLLDRWQIDDPMGAISIFGAGGLWGVLAVGIFAHGRYGSGWNSVDRFASLAKDAAQQQQSEKTMGVAADGVRGILYGDAGQLGAQLIYCAALATVGFALAYASFRISGLICGMRMRREVELKNQGAQPAES